MTKLCDTTGSGRPSVYIETYGCSFNVSDSEVMAGLLERSGYEITGSADCADAVIVNSCTVKDRSYLNFRKRINELGEEESPAVILTGCVPRVYQHSSEFSRFSQIGPDNLAIVPEVVRRTLAGETVKRLEREPAQRLNLPKRRHNPVVEIIPINKGCLGSCTFCQTVIARGRLYSFGEEEILEQLRRAVDDGVREVWLTSQDCGAYGLDRGRTLPRLLRRIAQIDGDFRVRVGMANPDFVKMFVHELADVLAHPRFYQFAHIPVQAGSDKVLRDMARMYTVDEFQRVVDSLREKLPQITIATDVIAGFPTETEEDFRATLDMLRDVHPPVVNRSRFSPRPGTKAARLPQLHSSAVSYRSKQLTEAARRATAVEACKWIGWTGEVTVQQLPKPGVALTRNFAYKPIIVSGTLELGRRLDVQITRGEGFHLCGEIVGSGD